MPLETFPSAGPFDNEIAARTEKHRLDAVRRYDILDTPPDGAFDRITALASQLVRVPVAIVSIVDHDRIWFKSHHGLDVKQIDRDPGLCASCILQDGPWIVNNAKTDPRALANPLVAGEFGAQFYLGIPLRTADGFNLGTLCVVDFVPRVASEHEVSVLTNLAAVVMDELELRLSARRALQSYHEELARRERREDHVHALMRELAHRSKNLLAVVQAIARQTAPNSQTIGDYVARLAARVQGLAHTHDLIADEDWHGVTMLDLAGRHLAPFIEDHSGVHLAGPPLVLRPVAAQNIGLALHELATNAVKHGALSVSEGKIDLAWQRDKMRLHVSWQERDGPPVTPPVRRGFGCVVLENIAPHSLDGEATLVFDPQGVRWELGAPDTHAIHEA